MHEQYHVVRIARNLVNHPMTEDQLVTVGSYIDPIQAHIASGRLESEGIPVVVADEHYIWANWMLSNALGGVKVQVPSSYAEKSRQILSDLA